MSAWININALLTCDETKLGPPVRPGNWPLTDPAWDRYQADYDASSLPKGSEGTVLWRRREYDLNVVFYGGLRDRDARHVPEVLRFFNELAPEWGIVFLEWHDPIDRVGREGVWLVKDGKLVEMTVPPLTPIPLDDPTTSTRRRAARKIEESDGE